MAGVNESLVVATPEDSMMATDVDKITEMTMNTVPRLSRDALIPCMC